MLNQQLWATLMILQQGKYSQCLFYFKTISLTCHVDLVSLCLRESERERENLKRHTYQKVSLLVLADTAVVDGGISNKG